MAKFPEAPTYADPVVIDETTGEPKFNPLWLSWFLQMAAYVNQTGSMSGTIKATSLTPGHKINGVLYDGSTDIIIPPIAGAG